MAKAAPHSNEMTVDKLFDVLSNGDRRVILAYLLEQQSPLTVEELVDRVVSAETNRHARQDNLRSRVRISLYHNHLPKLADADMIDFDTDRGLITVTEAAAVAEPYLELEKEDDRHE